jgi:hypothetical protein
MDVTHKYKPGASMHATVERAHVRPEVLDDFIAVHSKNFAINESGIVMAGEQTPSDYLNNLWSDENQSHWWPTSQGAGMKGNNGRNGGAGDLGAKLSAVAQADDMKEYRKIRQQMSESRN